MSYELKVKANTLWAESKIIRRIERKIKLHRRKLRTTTKLAIIKDITREVDGIPCIEPTRYYRVNHFLSDNNKGFDTKHELDLLSLQKHRKEVVGFYARKTHLARAFIKGTPYITVETPAKQKHRRAHSQRVALVDCTKDVASMARKYGGESMHNVTEEQVKEWIKNTCDMKVTHDAR